MSAHPAPQLRRAPPDGRAKLRPPRVSRFLRPLHSGRRACQSLGAWVLATTVVPRWLPGRWRHPLISYLLALGIDVVAASLTLLLVTLFPAFDLEEVLLLAGVVLVALTCGVGPSLLATVVGLALLEWVLPASHAFEQHPADRVDVVVLLMSGIGLSLLTGQSGWARRRAEALTTSLREAQAESDLERLRLRALVDGLPVPVALLDAQEQMLEFNPALQTFLGVPSPPRTLADCQQAKAWWPATGQPVAPQMWPIARAALTGERVTNEEIELETADGQRKIVLDSATPIRDEHGILYGAVGVFQDMTERKRLEEALRQAEQDAEARARELEAIFEALTDGLLVYDAQGRVLRANSAARGIFGFETQPEFASLPWQERASHYGSRDAEGQPVQPEDLVLSRLLRGEVFTSAQAADELLETPDGREVTVSITGGSLRGARGAISGAVVIVRDVTARRRLEQQTRDTLHALLAMAEALVEAPEQGVEALAYGAPEPNHVACRLAELTQSVLGCRYVGIAAVEPGTGQMTPITLVGVSPEQAQQWWASWDASSRLGQHLQPGEVAALQAGEPILVTSAHTPFPQGRDLMPGAPSMLVPMRMGDTLVGLLRVEGDTTEAASRRPHRPVLISAVARLGALVLERERLIASREAAQASELALRETQAQMDTFLGMAGHELKTPLTSLKLSLQVDERRMRRLLQRETVEAPALAPSLDRLALGLRQVERLDRLVNDLLEVSRVQAGKLDLHLEAADLAAIVREAVEEQRQAHPERTLVFPFPADWRVLLRADADRIGQVVTNYVTNALKYSPADRPVAVGLEVEEGQARVWVRDQGPGLPVEEQARIWERFHRVKGIEVQSGTGIGLGLGLYICRTMIERHHGQVGVESVPGQGSTFWFTVPLERREEEQLPRASHVLNEQKRETAATTLSNARSVLPWTRGLGRTGQRSRS